MYLVHVERPKSLKNKWDFRHDYFPRKIACKKEALELAREAKEKGGTSIRVEKVK